MAAEIELEIAGHNMMEWEGIEHSCTAQALQHRMVGLMDNTVPEADAAKLLEGNVGPVWIRDFAFGLENFIGTQIHVGADAHPSAHCVLCGQCRRCVPVVDLPIGGGHSHRPQEQHAVLVIAVNRVAI